MTIRSVSPALLRRLAPVLLATLIAAPAAAQNFEPALGPAEPFSFDTLADKAKAMSKEPFEPYPVQSPELFDKIDYDAHWKIVFRKEHTVDVGGAPVQFFHQGRYFKEPVTINLVKDGEAREVLYNADYFTMPEDSPAKAVEDFAGWAGFRVMRPDMKTDWISFLGASYFRTDGPDKQYGLSARALAVDTGLSTPEEFPRFTAFYLEEDDKPGDNIVIYALLDSPSVAGAYRIEAENTDGEGQVLHIKSKLFFREAVERLGIAPLTSMYWYSETHRNMAFDWRPEVHDSDGLEVVTGSGEQIWRPLNNPDRVVTSSFYDENPKGFGLIQRDRNFDHYQDDGVFYNKRSSAWVVPEGDWGKGMVQLVELPSDDEIYDNIVAYWLPEDLPEAGDERDFSYTLNWVETAPPNAELAETIASRVGRGGVPGQPRPRDQVKVVVDFSGRAVKGLTVDDDVKPNISVGAGAELINAYAMPIVGTDDWRLTYDLKFDDTADTIDVRAYLDQDGKPLTETWLGQFHRLQFENPPN
ncbi:glucan biosynthesis protein [Martelella endophytica]|uniref:Glucan biosynthesis protein D n=1 Tax=Martelella endophytica TaxID=1486262 RepID=A0A0D5LPF0_MAREN|nr:glucan biosynthesis protein [Martelella endophytica]AJY45203.1 glucan biosynthesis protein D [Martelella endophytica]